MRNAKKIFLIVIIAIAFSFTAAAGYVYYEMRNIKVNAITKNDEELGIKQEDTNTKQPEKRDVLNIALFGVDTGRQKMEAAHSDTIMILSIDRENKKVKLSSIMRDSYVNVDGHGNTKITNAYAYGGPELAIRTLNENFNLDIRDYVTIDFAGLSSIINMLGGIEVNVKKTEISEVNKYAAEVARIKGEKPRPVTKPGKQILMGNEAVSYARIRHVGNGDFERIERQQIVLTKLFEKFKKQDPIKYSSIISKTLKYVETSMDKTTIIELGINALTSGVTPTTLEFARFPVDGYWKCEMIDKISYITYDLNTAKDQINKFIYDDEKPVAESTGK